MTAAQRDDENELDPPLGFQEEDPVWGAQLRVKGLGDGLSKLAEVEPVLIKRGQTGVLLVEWVANYIAFPAGEGPHGEDGVMRLAVLNAGNVALIDRAVVAKALDEHQRRLDELSKQKAMLTSSGEVEEDAKPGEGDDLTEAEAAVKQIFDGPGSKKRGPRSA